MDDKITLVTFTDPMMGLSLIDGIIKPLPPQKKFRYLARIFE